jgi:large subunit ribosomal protein L23
MELRDVIKAPMVTEKGTDVGEHGQVVFEVDTRACKDDIRKAVEKLFEVKVASVRTMNYLGRKVRRGKVLGRKRAWKKAYVTLAEGEVIDLMEKV